VVGRIALTCCASWLALSSGASASEPWKSATEVAEVTVRVRWVSEQELRRIARSVGKRAESAPFAFSVLRKNVLTGAFSCDVYLVERPGRVNDRATATLGHELAHCLGFSHEP
jgi:hypothetical protein